MPIHEVTFVHSPYLLPLVLKGPCQILLDGLHVQVAELWLRGIRLGFFPEEMPVEADLGDGEVATGDIGEGEARVG